MFICRYVEWSGKVVKVGRLVSVYYNSNDNESLKEINDRWVGKKLRRWRDVVDLKFLGFDYRLEG